MGLPKIEKKKLLLLVGLALVILVGFGFYYGRVVEQRQEASELLLNPLPLAEVEEEPPLLMPEPEPELEPQILAVHVKGAVYNPGLFELVEGSRVACAVNVAIPLEEANLDLINLAFVLVDAMEVIVPFKVEGEETDWATLLQASAMAGGAGGNPAAAGAGSEASAATSGGAATEAPFTGIVNINTDNSSRLQSLPGIGPARAQAIIDHRDAHGSFARIEDIMRVSGIGQAIFNNIRGRISVY
jgi:competence protein ComEA